MALDVGTWVCLGDIARIAKDERGHTAVCLDIICVFALRQLWKVMKRNLHALSECHIIYVVQQSSLLL